MTTHIGTLSTEIELTVEPPPLGRGSDGEVEACWNEARQLLRTRAGHRLEFDDSSGSIRIEHAGGQTITLAADGSIRITANNTMMIHAPSGLTVVAPTATFSGAVTCTTLTAAISVVTPSSAPHP